MNRFYGQQQTNMPQPMELPQQTQNVPQMGLNRALLNGKQVESIDIVKSLEIPLDGSISYFPLVNGTAIATKQLMQDGTSKITIYEPKKEKDIKYVTSDEFDEKVKDYEELEEQLEDIKKELKEIKSKLKTKKED
ncbi:MAG: hypothetical protein SPI94_04075 [Candidatus Onthovivens sp.]|nr:hypothetical protein [Candidatus Onthovivens sp.]